MSNLTISEILKSETVEKVLIGGNLKSLTSAERVQYYEAYCKSFNLNPIARPFDYIEFQGKLVLYANKGCAEQLRQTRKVSVTISAREKIDDLIVVTARAKLPDGREDESTGAVNAAGLRGDALANAMMKAETKAKRRVTLSICGLNMLDETETETIPGARAVSVQEAEGVFDEGSPDGPAMKMTSIHGRDPLDTPITSGYMRNRTIRAALNEKGLPEVQKSVNFHLEKQGGWNGKPDTKQAAIERLPLNSSCWIKPFLEIEAEFLKKKSPLESGEIEMTDEEAEAEADRMMREQR